MLEFELDSHSQVEGQESFAKLSDVKIFISNQYDKFNLSKFNRNPGHYKKVKESIENNNYTQFQPILVCVNAEGELEIVDGQNRFLACKELGLPIHFIISEDITIYAAADINQASKNWSSMDYARHYANRGREPYIKLLDLCAKFNQKISVVQSFGKLSKGASSHSVNVRNGNFEFRDDINVDEFFEYIDTFKQYYPNFYNKERFVKAMLKVYLHPEFDREQMDRKLELTYAILREQPRVDMMIDEILKVYNYKSRNPIVMR